MIDSVGTCHYIWFVNSYTEDAYWEAGRQGSAQGRDRILAMMAGSPTRTPFIVHMVMNPFIEFDQGWAMNRFT